MFFWTINLWLVSLLNSPSPANQAIAATAIASGVQVSACITWDESGNAVQAPDSSCSGAKPQYNPATGTIQ